MYYWGLHVVDLAIIAARFGKKRDSLSMDVANGLSATVVRIGVGETVAAPSLPYVEVSWVSGCVGCGRDAGSPAPPAQIRTCSIPAYGSYLGCLAAKRTAA